ncbi:MAG: M12 family metallo-peptidase [Planctomycetota bacterium]
MQASSPRARRVAAGVFTVFGVVLMSALAGALRLDPAQRPYPAPPQLCGQFGIVAGTVQHLDVEAAPNGDRAVRVELAGTTYTLALMPHDVRAPGFRLLVRDDAGVHEVPRPANVTYRGSVLEDQGSWVAAAIDGPAVQALVRMANGEEWGIQQVREVQPGAGPALHVVYRTADNTTSNHLCGVNSTMTGPVPEPVGLDLAWTCEIACEADFQFYQANGSSTVATQNDVTAVVNAVSAIYLSDVQTNFTITQILVNTSSAANPYSTNDPGGLLGEFQTHWAANHAGVQRDIAHLFTGRNLTGSVIGIAQLGVVCAPGYGLVQSRFRTNFTQRTGLSAHELGHNFNAQHCDGINPCYIMCSGLGGCNNSVTTFGASARNQIASFVQSRTCLTVIPNPAQITGIAPATVTTFAPGTVTLTGAGFIGALQVQVGSTVLTSGFTTPDDNTLRFNPPVGTPIGATTVQVTNSLGASNTVQLQVQATDPCQLQVNGAVLGGQSLVWNMGGGPGNTWAMLLGLGPTTSPFQGWPVLDNNLVLGFGVLDPGNGLASFSLPVPAGALAGLTIYTQMAELLATPVLNVDSTSAVRSTLIFN